MRHPIVGIAMLLRLVLLIITRALQWAMDGGRAARARPLHPD